VGFELELQLASVLNVDPSRLAPGAQKEYVFSLPAGQGGLIYVQEDALLHATRAAD
jgi:hypothetical protein